jgi:chromosome segregation ATPase
VEHLKRLRDADDEHERQLVDIQRAWDELTKATSDAKESLKAATETEGGAWAALKQAIEEAVPADQPAVERAEAMLTKLHRAEIAWQDYNEAREAKKEKQKEAKAAIKVAKATLDRAIRSAETGQGELF